MKFIDLFAGLGGFHIALSRLGHKCVYACEINPRLNDLYKKNFPGIDVGYDITKVDLSKIPNYDILCAGFPCQPFSKAGNQDGFNHKIAGEMFEEIIRFLKFHRPSFIILENVANLFKHNRGLTWEYMQSKLESLNYNIDSKILSPVDFNIPQTRERFYVLGSQDSFKIKWPINPIPRKISLEDIFIKEPRSIMRLTKDKKDIFNKWSDFLRRIPSNVNLCSPLWTLEFGATYPFEDTTPFALGSNKISKYKGSRGIDLSKIKPELRLENIPPYAQYSSRRNEDSINKKNFPEWKKKFIRNSRKYYNENKDWIDPWIKKYDKHKNLALKNPTHQKLEWNCFGDEYSLDDKIVSFRASGFRVKRMEASPTLVNTSNSALPYIPKLKRFLSIEECMSIQGLRELINDNIPKEYDVTRSVGNAVNADVVEKIAEAFLDKKSDIKKYTSQKKQLKLQLGSDNF